MLLPASLGLIMVELCDKPFFFSYILFIYLSYAFCTILFVLYFLYYIFSFFFFLVITKIIFHFFFSSVCKIVAFLLG